MRGALGSKRIMLEIGAGIPPLPPACGAPGRWANTFCNPPFCGIRIMFEAGAAGIGDCGIPRGRAKMFCVGSIGI